MKSNWLTLFLFFIAGLATCCCYCYCSLMVFERQIRISIVIKDGKDNKDSINDDNNDKNISDAIQRSIFTLKNLGLEICYNVIDIDSNSNNFYHRANFPSCKSLVQQQTRRILQEQTLSDSLSSTKSNYKNNIELSFLDYEDEEAGTESYIINALLALLCVTIAALAAGLTLGMLGLDPLMLLIKERASNSIEERYQAKKLLPIISQHHRLLVSLLLMNAVANEALPIFLEKLVPPAFAVLVSVTLVLFFGEIIPSAIFTGPKQMYIASTLVPLVQVVLFILYPIAGPIAKLLDWLLHDHDDSHSDDGDHNGPIKPKSGANYTRTELAALIRIQYEERLAVKHKRKTQRRSVQLPMDHVGPIDFTTAETLRAAKHMAEHYNDELTDITTAYYNNPDTESSGEFYFLNNDQDDCNIGNSSDHQADRTNHSIHKDEVTMVEGALQMQTKVALDVYTPMRRVFSIPSNMKLTEQNMVKIYASGYTRIPVHELGNKNAIIGILMTKLLIVVNSREARPVSTLPLRSPHCISPAMSLVDTLNILQSGGKGSIGGHLALVCARPTVGEHAFTQNEPLPEMAGLMGIITLEDCLEMLLQEQIYDEMDKKERQEDQIAIMVVKKWKRYVKRKKSGKLSTADTTTTTTDAANNTPAIHPVVQQDMNTSRKNNFVLLQCCNSSSTTTTGSENTSATETTALLLELGHNQSATYF